MNILIPLALAACLAGCATGNLHQLAEKADTDASLTYAAVADTVNAYEALPGADVAKAEGLKLEAWKALVVERHAYDIGQAVDLTALHAILSQAKGLHL